jgi:hypothetical protein
MKRDRLRYRARHLVLSRLSHIEAKISRDSKVLQEARIVDPPTVYTAPEHWGNYWGNITSVPPR